MISSMKDPMKITGHKFISSPAPGPAPGAVLLCFSCIPSTAYPFISFTIPYAFYRIFMLFYSLRMQNQRYGVPFSIAYYILYELVMYTIRKTSVLRSLKHAKAVNSVQDQHIPFQPGLFQGKSNPSRRKTVYIIYIRTNSTYIIYPGR